MTIRKRNKTRALARKLGGARFGARMPRALTGAGEVSGVSGGPGWIKLNPPGFGELVSQPAPFKEGLLDKTNRVHLGKLKKGRF